MMSKGCHSCFFHLFLCKTWPIVEVKRQWSLFVINERWMLQVTDMMLQEKLYPKWAVGARKWWNTRYNRIILFWIVVVTSSFIVVFVIATDYINWDSLNRDFLHSNELSRAILASFILVMDITIVMQVNHFIFFKMITWKDNPFLYIFDVHCNVCDQLWIIEGEAIHWELV